MSFATGRAKRIVATAVFAFAGLISLSGCATVPNEPTNQDRIGVVVVAGAGPENGGWRAWAYHTRTGDVCVEVRGSAGGGFNCGRGDGALQAPGIVVTEKGSFVLGGTRVAGATDARLDDADGSHATAHLVATDSIAAGLRLYVLAAPLSAHPQTVAVLDAAGTVIESDALGR